MLLECLLEYFGRTMKSTDQSNTLCIQQRVEIVVRFDENLGQIRVCKNGRSGCAAQQSAVFAEAAIRPSSPTAPGPAKTDIGREA